MKTNTLIIGLVFLLAACTTAPQTEPVPQGEAQVINVGVEGATYTFDRNAEAGSPVQLVFDMDQLQGCSRAVTIPAYNVNKVVSHNDNVVEFTPMASGPVKVSCTMAMYTGELMVK